MRDDRAAFASILIRKPRARGAQADERLSPMRFSHGVCWWPSPRQPHVLCVERPLRSGLDLRPGFPPFTQPHAKQLRGGDRLRFEPGVGPGRSWEPTFWCGRLVVARVDEYFRKALL